MPLYFDDLVATRIEYIDRLVWCHTGRIKVDLKVVIIQS